MNYQTMISRATNSHAPAKSDADERYQQQVKKFNLGNLIRGMADPSFSGWGLEAEVSQELASRTSIKPSGYLVPFEVLHRGLTVGSPSAGGNTVATNLLSNNFIDLLRPTSIVASMGATHLTGLAGNVAIPRQTAGSTCYWVAENGAPSESGQSFDQVPMAPKTLGAYSDISRKMLLQSSIDISSFVISDLRAALGQELDRAVLNGSGADSQPLGILNNSAINTVALGANGAALTWGDLVDLWTAVDQANADRGSFGYVTTNNVRGKLQQTQKIAVSGSDFIWSFAQTQKLPGEGVISEARAVATNLMPSNLTKGTSVGVCSSMIAGNWSDLVIGQWGAGLDILIDPYTHSSNGALRITAFTDVDFVVRHAESFVKVKDILTT